MYSLRLYFLICLALLYIIAVYNNGLKMKKIWCDYYYLFFFNEKRLRYLVKFLFLRGYLPWRSALAKKHEDIFPESQPPLHTELFMFAYRIFTHRKNEGPNPNFSRAFNINGHSTVSKAFLKSRKRMAPVKFLILKKLLISVISLMLWPINPS